MPHKIPLHDIQVEFRHDLRSKTTRCKLHSRILTESTIVYATCSQQDQFCRKIGRKVSLGRAMIEAGLSRERRFLEWDAYRNLSDTPAWPATILNSRIHKRLEKKQKLKIKYGSNTKI